MLAITRTAAVRADSTLVSLREIHRDGAAAVDLEVLLPIAPANQNGVPCALLEGFGLRQNGTPLAWACDLRQVRTSTVAGACAALLAELGPRVLWDMGPVFPHEVDEDLTSRKLPGWWKGAFLVRVACTGRCLVFDRQATAEQIQRAYQAEYRAHLRTEWAPSE
jgi:hypothetical protein